MLSKMSYQSKLHKFQHKSNNLCGGISILSVYVWILIILIIEVNSAPHAEFSQQIKWPWANIKNQSNNTQQQNTSETFLPKNSYLEYITTTPSTTPTKPEIWAPPGIFILAIFGVTCWACFYHPKCCIAKMRQRGTGSVYQTLVTNGNTNPNANIRTALPSTITVTTTTTTNVPPPQGAPVNITNHYNNIHAPCTVHGNFNAPPVFNTQQPQQQYYGPEQQNLPNQYQAGQTSAYSMPMPNQNMHPNIPPQFSYNPHFSEVENQNSHCPTAPYPGIQ